MASALPFATIQFSQEISPSSSASTDLSPVTFAEHVEYARVTREEQRAARVMDETVAQRHTLGDYLTAAARHCSPISAILNKFRQSKQAAHQTERETNSIISLSSLGRKRRSLDSPRASNTRTASRTAVFFLIVSVCTPAPFTVYSFTTLGFGLAILFEFILAWASYFASECLWQTFLGLDSFRYPVKTYGDLADRIYGKWISRVIVIIQSLDLFLATGNITIQAASWAIRMVQKSSLCFPVACLITTASIICLAEIRPLHAFQWISMISFLITFLQFFIEMGTSVRVNVSIDFFKSRFPNRSIEPIRHVFGYPGPHASFFKPLTPPWVFGIASIHNSYWGNIVFTEFMAEMKDVAGFRTALRWVWLWLFFQHVLIGIVFYALQGQYAWYSCYLFPNGENDDSLASFSALLGTLFFIIQGALMANIAIKVILRGTLNKLSTTGWNARKIAILWAVIVPSYMLLTYLLAVCTPYYTPLSGVYFSLGWGFVAYGLPPILYLGYCFRLYKLIPSDGTYTDPGARRNAVMLGPANPWVSDTSKQRFSVAMALFILMIAVLISATIMWLNVADFLYLAKYGAWKPVVASCTAT